MKRRQSEPFSMDKYFNLNLKMMSLIGAINSKKQMVTGKMRFMWMMPTYLYIAFSLHVAVGHIRNIIRFIKGGKGYLAAQALAHSFTNYAGISKGFRMATSVDEIWSLFQDIRINWERHPPQNEKIGNHVAEGAARTIFYSYLFFSSMSTVVCSISLPIIAQFFVHCVSHEATNSSTYVPYRILLFDAYPFIITNDLTNFLLLSYEMYVLVYWNVMYFCCDGWFAQFTTHVSLQLEVLKNDVEALIDQKDAGNELKSNFVMIVHRHRELLRICDIIEELYSPVILAVVILSSTDICLNLFDLTELFSQGKYVVALPHIGLISATFCQIVFYCAFAELLAGQTSSVADALYNSNWPMKTNEFRFYVQTIIMRSQKPSYCTAYGFFPINHERLSKILNAAFSYFMMMRTMRG